MNKFYTVFGVTTTTGYSVKFATTDEAQEFAERQATIAPGRVFVVMEAVAAFSIPLEVQEERIL